ncbi:hypothetical protein [Flavobacterium ammonificans]|uniref:Uncharacterized protein n=1 Tax=Flavobacterium ammonificans TaxID=1751056 RepID=A0ABN6KTE9_9FLAO|nr:hypothetical protein [Flavobacterium ammonificans]BDB52413.1 hypothetical protein GENT11_07250 [Flavobacterium ammonificans]
MKRTKDTISAPIFNHLTLGKRSSFDYAIENGVLLLRFGKMNYFLAVKNEIVESVKERINQVNKTDKEIYTFRTSLYNQPKWQECPNNKISVYVACLLIHHKI